MKDRDIVCVHYVCAHAECAKGFKDVTTAKCKNCAKYRPRKTTKREETIRHKRQKDRDRHDDWRRDY